ncbi:G5 domain-containing protein [Bifidobacterium magnum]|uniref:Putative phage protein n=1 Tax=Bifidobacterium magnum TaxID=1692 RepID=A0A087BEZ2_9BIFI|nr:G5 domain-containing protein [Bifidobacterium magnum]KFI69592.1 putative phage protein [Bifidobacterium magnum]
MANHRKVGVPTLRSLSKRQWIRICVVIAAIALVVTGCLVTRSYYMKTTASPKPTVTAYSATDKNAEAASRGNAREQLGGDTASIKVVINGASQTVLGTNFTDVKSVLDDADITLEPDDTVSPSLTTKVDESTTITINRAGAVIENVDKDIAYNTIRKEDPNLAQGSEKVQTEGKNGVLEVTNLVQRSGNKVISSNELTSYVKTAPVDKVVLVGTKAPAKQPAATTSGSSNSGSNSGSSSNNSGNSGASSIGTTTPIGEMQQWAHDYLLSNGYTEADFTATVYIISHESGWSVNATNPSSGAYGLPQALPGSKMVSAGADWATNYQTQLKWFWQYCAERYGSIQGAYAYWLANHCY